MKKLTLDQWEEKWVGGPIERFDYKYQMFLRPFWDKELQARLKDWSFFGDPIDKPGYTLQDQALRFAAWRGDIIGLLNNRKPNPMPGTEAIYKTMDSTGAGTPATAYRFPEGSKIDVDDPERITRDVKKVATYFGASKVGICKLDRRWVYSHTFPDMSKSSAEQFDKPPESTPQEIPEEFKYAIVMCFEEDYEILRYWPSYIFVGEFYRGYSQLAFTNLLFSAFIENLGFKVIDDTTNDVAISPPMAMQAGLGELGRNGLLITPEFGPRVRISKILTDLPLVPDSPIEFGVTEFCDVCMKCAEFCPSRSISHGDRTTDPQNISNVGGGLKWSINAEQCRMYWTKKKADCGICVSVCPFNKPNTWPHRIVRWFVDNMRWGDRSYVKMDDIFGYGKRRKPDNFWEEWKPKPR